MQNLIHLCKGDVFKSKDALDVVVRNKDAIHASHSDLKRIFEHGGSHHVEILPFI